VYVDKRELKCACVGGSSNLPLGFVSLTENLMMVAMGRVDGCPHGHLIDSARAAKLGLDDDGVGRARCGDAPASIKLTLRHSGIVGLVAPAVT
jgi:hypothetical protein